LAGQLGDDEQSDLGADIAELWLHVSLQYEAPWRPTFTLLQRRAADPLEAPYVPLQVTDGSYGPGSRPTIVSLTLWEALRKLDISKPLALRWFRLVASPRRAVHTVEAWKQRATALVPEVMAFWAGAEVERESRLAAAKRRREPRPRGPARGGPRPRPRDMSEGEGEEGESDEQDELQEALADALSDEDGENLAQSDEDEAYDDDVNVFGLPSDAEAEAEAEAESDEGADLSDSSASTSSSSSSSSSSRSGSSSSLPVGRNRQESMQVPIPDFASSGSIRVFCADDGRVDLYAVCPCQAAHGKCVKTRTCKSGSKPGQGRPLGFLVAWLRAAARAGMETKAAHFKYEPTFAERKEARTLLKAWANANTVLAFERPQTSTRGVLRA